MHVSRVAAVCGGTAALGVVVWLLFFQNSGPPKVGVERGEELVEGGSCRSCHQQGNVFRAPPLEGLYGKTRKLVDGREVKADDAYLLKSLVSPRADVVEGYAANMPGFGGVWSEKDLENVLLYLKSL